MSDRKGMGYVLAVGAVGAALIVLIVGASTIGAFGHTVPKELWGIGGALSGALVGILVPAPRTTGSRKAEAAATVLKLHEDALQQAKQDAEKAKGKAEAAPGAGEAVAATTKADNTVGIREAEYEVAHHAATQAVTQAAQEQAGWSAGLKTIATEAKILVPLTLFAVTLALGVLLGLGVIHAEACPKAAPGCAYYAAEAKQAANVLIALASAAGGALLGVFATPPGGAAKEA